MKKYFSILSFVFIAILTISSCKKGDSSEVNNTKGESPLTLYKTVEFDKSQVETMAADIEKNTSIRLASGLNAKIWASDSMVPDPIALQIDNKGTAYVTRTVRQKNSEFDIRGFEHWKIPSIALESPEDRRKFLRGVFAPELSATNTWVPDLNKDGVHDWKDLGVQKEEIHIIEDTDGDGLADKARGYMINMMDEITDIAGGLLVRARDAFLGMAPNIWRLTDSDNDGLWDEKKSISKGYAVHIGFSGHNVSGVVEGPDGKIYWGIGDIGASIEDLEGKKYPYPHCGVICRSNPDGSDFEIIATGLRNTHEFAFDDFGNIITCDNDGDHAGESERLVHIVQGSDAGWRTHWQFGKYSDPKNNKYNVWMDENLYKPYHEGQAAYIVPPIKNFHNGPTGFIHNPGTALGKKWLNKFFVVEFVGSPANSKIWAFGLKPKGSSFDLDTEEEIVSGILPTGIQFGPDGALYASDWVTGWNTKDFGRIWKIDVTDKSLENQRKKTKMILSQDFTKLSVDTLAAYLGNEDKRIRLKAQFQLVELGEKGKSLLSNASKAGNPLLKRVHAIWGLGQLYRSDDAVSALLLPLLNDTDPEVLTQVVKVLGDPKKPIATEQITNLLTNSSSRLVFHAAEALGRMKVKTAYLPLLEVAKKIGKSDLYLRHAVVHSLSQVADDKDLISLASNENEHVRLAAVLTLRRLKPEGLTQFLSDKNQDIVAEAARGINDDGGILKAMPQLAKLLTSPGNKNEIIMRRAINAAVRTGNSESLKYLFDYSFAKETPSPLRQEALSALSSWHSPSVLDRVDGRYIGVVTRDSAEVRSLVKANYSQLLKMSNPQDLAAVAKMMVAHNIAESKSLLVDLFYSTKDEDLKSVLLRSLKSLKLDKINDVVKASLTSKSDKLKSVAISLIDDSMVDGAQFSEMADLTFKNGSSKEKQQILKLMANLKPKTVEPSVNVLIKSFNEDKLPKEIELEFFTLIDSLKNDKFTASMDKKRKSAITDNYSNALYGGDGGKGYGTFFWNSTAMCIRCHKVDGEGSDVGPDLSKIGSILSREQILEAMVKPDVRIAPGYGTAIVTLTDDVSHTGILMSDNAKAITLKTSEAEPLVLAKSRIKTTEMLPSSMPNAAKKISIGEIRDLVEYLSGLK